MVVVFVLFLTLLLAVLLALLLTFLLAFLLRGFRILTLVIVESCVVVTRLVRRTPAIRTFINEYVTLCYVYASCKTHAQTLV